MVTSSPGLLPDSGVRINVGDNWQTIVSSKPTGTTFLVAAGMYARTNGDAEEGQGSLASAGRIMSGNIPSQKRSAAAPRT